MVNPREHDAYARPERRGAEDAGMQTGRAIPRPPHWGGFRLVPSRIEFWRAGTFRLHDRQLFVRDGDTWSLQLLYP